MRGIPVLIFSLLLVACSSVKVNYDYDREVDFSAYTTYNYFSDMQSGLSPLDEKRLLTVLDSTLQRRGYRLVDEPDFFINIMASEYPSGPRNTVGVGLGGGGRNIGGGIAVGIPLGSPRMRRSIQIDFVDAQRDALFWQAVAESGFREDASPFVKGEKFKALVQKVFSKYPPKDR